MVKIIGTKTAKFYKEGVVYNVTEEIAKIVIAKGDAKAFKKKKKEPKTD